MVAAAKKSLAQQFQDLNAGLIIAFNTAETREGKIGVLRNVVKQLSPLGDKVVADENALVKSDEDVWLDWDARARSQGVTLDFSEGKVLVLGELALEAN